jgi:hypothetical protein
LSNFPRLGTELGLIQIFFKLTDIKVDLALFRLIDLRAYVVIGAGYLAKEAMDLVLHVCFNIHLH